MFTIRKKFRIEMAHKLFSASSEECKWVHGHSYIVEVFVQSRRVNDDGMVVDFKDLKCVVSPFLDQIDHGLMLPSVLEDEQIHRYDHDHDRIIIVPFNPTAELLAKWLFHRLRSEVNKVTEDRRGRLLKVRVHETESGWAEYEQNEEGE